MMNDYESLRTNSRISVEEIDEKLSINKIIRKIKLESPYELTSFLNTNNNLKQNRRYVFDRRNRKQYTSFDNNIRSSFASTNKRESNSLKHRKILYHMLKTTHKKFSEQCRNFRCTSYFRRFPQSSTDTITKKQRNILSISLLN